MAAPLLHGSAPHVPRTRPLSGPTSRLLPCRRGTKAKESVVPPRSETPWFAMAGMAWRVLGTTTMMTGMQELAQVRKRAEAIHRREVQTRHSRGNLSSSRRRGGGMGRFQVLVQMRRA